MPTPSIHANPAARQAAYRARLAEARRKELEAKGMPPLPAVATMPGNERWQALVRQASHLLQTVQDEMQDYYDERSPAWCESERGVAFQDRLEAVQEAQGIIEDLINN